MRAISYAQRAVCGAAMPAAAMAMGGIDGSARYSTIKPM